MVVIVIADRPGTVGMAKARSALAVHRPAVDGLCNGCLDAARLALWPCPHVDSAAILLTTWAAKDADRCQVPVTLASSLQSGTTDDLPAIHPHPGPDRG